MEKKKKKAWNERGGRKRKEEDKYRDKYMKEVKEGEEEGETKEHGNKRNKK